MRRFGYPMRGEQMVATPVTTALKAAAYRTTRAEQHAESTLWPPFGDNEREHAVTALELKLDLPDSLAQEATRMGLLDPDSLQALLSEAVRSRRRPMR